LHGDFEERTVKEALGGEEPQEHNRGRVAVSVVSSSNLLAKMAGVGLLVGLVVGVTSSGVSDAASAKPMVPGIPAGPTAPATLGKAQPNGHPHPPIPPPGYTVATSGDITAPAGAQTDGAATCPSGTVPFGGGAFVSSSSLSVNINSSIPLENTWEVWVNNGSASGTFFDVYVTCGTQPAKYAVVQSTDIANPSGSQSGAYAGCTTKGTVVLGGGGFSFSGDTSVNLNTSEPTGYFWFTNTNNASASNSTSVAYAVCGKKPKGYVFVEGSRYDNPVGAETNAVVTCPGVKVPLGGGINSGSEDLTVNINSTYPVGSSWSSYENNASAFDASATPYVICAGRK
jgi:hypothetical protein